MLPGDMPCNAPCENLCCRYCSDGLCTDNCPCDEKTSDEGAAVAGEDLPNSQVQTAKRAHLFHDAILPALRRNMVNYV